MRRLLLLLLFIPGLAIAGTGVTIPFHLTKQGLIEINVKVNGVETRGVLDSGTGGGGMVISTEFAKTLGLKPGKSGIHASGGGKGKQLLYPVSLKQVRFGPVTLHDVAGLAANLRPISATTGFPVGVLLGYPFFAHHVVTIDFPKQQIHVYNPGEAPVCPSPIPMTLQNNIPVVTAQVSIPTAHLSQTVHLYVDLGSANAAAIFGEPFRKTAIGKAINADKKDKTGGSGISGAVSGIATTLPELRVGDQRFHNLTVATTRDVEAFNGKDVQGSLGELLWESGSITFDYPDHTLCIQPHSQPQTAVSVDAKSPRYSGAVGR